MLVLFTLWLFLYGHSQINHKTRATLGQGEIAPDITELASYEVESSVISPCPRVELFLVTKGRLFDWLVIEIVKIWFYHKNPLIPNWSVSLCFFSHFSLFISLVFSVFLLCQLMMPMLKFVKYFGFFLWINVWKSPYVKFFHRLK